MAAGGFVSSTAKAEAGCSCTPARAAAMTKASPDQCSGMRSQRCRPCAIAPACPGRMACAIAWRRAAWARCAVVNCAAVPSPIQRVTISAISGGGIHDDKAIAARIAGIHRSGAWMKPTGIVVGAVGIVNATDHEPHRWRYLRRQPVKRMRVVGFIELVERIEHEQDAVSLG